jgi:25S rRNA (uracil2634-N3)-methyltransferase
MGKGKKSKGTKRKRGAPSSGSGGGGHRNRRGRKYTGPPSSSSSSGMFVVGQNDFALHFSDQVLLQGGPQHLGPYSSRHKILVVGDGDLTFSLSLASALGGGKIVATTFDSFYELRKKYKGAPATVGALEAVGATVLHDVDATRMHAQLEDGKFHRIVFNFPHIGGATQEDVLLNQELLRDFFANARPRLNAAGECHVALRRTLFYDSWDIVAQAERSGLRLVRVERFKGDELLSYENQRTSGEGQVRQAPSIAKAKRYVFARDQSADMEAGPAVGVAKTVTSANASVDETKEVMMMKEKKKKKKKKMRRKASQMMASEPTPSAAAAADDVARPQIAIKSNKPSTQKQWEKTMRKKKKKRARFGSGKSVPRFGSASSLSLSLALALALCLFCDGAALLPPSPLVSSFSAFQTIRSASRFGPVFSNGSIYVDTVHGAYRTNSSDYLNAGGDWSDYLRICPNAVSYYLPEGGACEAGTPLPGQCVCESVVPVGSSSNSNCTRWAPFVSPSAIPADAVYAGNSSMNGYAHVDTWSFFYAPLGSAIDVSTVLGPDGMSFVTRTVGARVQTDFTDFVAGVPAASEFAKPKPCV